MGLMTLLILYDVFHGNELWTPLRAQYSKIFCTTSKVCFLLEADLVLCPRISRNDVKHLELSSSSPVSIVINDIAISAGGCCKIQSIPFSVYPRACVCHHRDVVSLFDSTHVKLIWKCQQAYQFCEMVGF